MLFLPDTTSSALFKLYIKITRDSLNKTVSYR